MKCPNCKKLHILKRPLCDKCYIAELEFKFSSKYWDEVGVEMMKIKAENQRLKEQLQTLIDMHGSRDIQGVVETLEALYLQQKALNKQKKPPTEAGG